MLARRMMPVIVIALLAVQALAGEAPYHPGLSLSGDWQVRMNAFYHFCQTGGRESLLAGTADRVELDKDDVQKIVDLFRLEAGSVRSATDLSEGQLSYFADLMSVASRLRDLRTLPVFLDPSVLESGGIATTGLARLGSAAVGPTLEKLSNVERSPAGDDTSYELSLILTLNKMLERDVKMSTADQTKMHSLMLDMSHGHDKTLSVAALRGLTLANDPIRKKKEVRCP